MNSCRWDRLDYGKYGWRLVASGYNFKMTFDQMLKELPTLTPAQRRELVDRAIALDEQEPGLNAEEEKMLEARIKAYESAPHTAISWEQVKTDVLRDFKK